MDRFLNASDEEFKELERQSLNSCRVFYAERMPPGATPMRARVGVQINSDNSALLCVDRSVAYTGANRDARAWLEAGEKSFASFGELKCWVRNELKGAYLVSSGAAEQPEAALRAEDLTDMEALRRSARQIVRTVCLDEGALFVELSKQIRGQGDALRALSGRVCRHLARQKPRRPLTFMAIGPTGVGKTRTAELLPQALKCLVEGERGYGYLRLDMSEYQESHRISQLFGSPQGYIGYGEGAQLVDALAATTQTIVLFDEIEKAHPNILRSLMNAMDAGRLSAASATAAGREIDCRRAIFIFTSNVHAGDILKEMETRDAFGNDWLADEICRRHLRAAGLAPELVGRIGCFLVYRPLPLEARLEIIALAIVSVAEEYGLRVGRIAPSVIEHICERGRSQEFGVRPDEYLVDDVLGLVFAEAARAQSNTPVEVCGPPFACVPLPATEERHNQQFPAKPEK